MFREPWAPVRKTAARLARGRRARIALPAGAAGAVLAVVLTVLGGTGHPARAPVAPPVTVRVPDPGSRAAPWLAGSANRLLSAVNADLGRLTVAERAANRGTARLAGLRLSADAKAALLGPAPPRGARLYRAALAELERAGHSAAGGRLRAAAASLRAGESMITEATALANSPAKRAAPGYAVQEPAGQ